MLRRWPTMRLAHMRGFDLRQLEHQREGHVRLLDCGLAAEEQPRLAVVVGEGLGADAALGAVVGGAAAKLRKPLAALRAGRVSARASWARS